MTSNVIVRSSSTGLSVNNGPSVLGERQAKIPVGGKIRPGIKVLTSNAAQHPKAKDIYARGVAEGVKWGAIERQLMEQCKFDRSPLTPKNVQYFSVFRDDFTNPAVADQLLELYGQEIEGKRRLLRFPVIFPTDSWQANLPHALQTFTASQLLYWSDYDADGQRRCFTRADASTGEKNKRATRTFGGRATILRPDNGGICDPENCPQYQTGKCNLKGSLLFFVPGVPGGSTIELPFTSFYGMNEARKAMEMVSFLRGGRISGTHNGKPIFYITKKQQDVSMLDRETGKPKRVSHWIITLEADIDMLTVFQAAEQRMALNGTAGAEAAAALSAPQQHDEDDEHDEALDGELVEPEPMPEGFTNVADGRRVLADMLESVGITAPAFSAWMVSAYQDADWSKHLEGLQHAHSLLTEAMAGDIEAWKKERNLDAPF